MKDSGVLFPDHTLAASEDIGRQLQELASISETILRALSRALTESLDPFTLFGEQDADDVSTLLSALARVNEEQMRLSSQHYAHTVMCRRDLFLSHSQFTEEATRNKRSHLRWLTTFLRFWLDHLLLELVSSTFRPQSVQHSLPQ
ncbi:hypothetical protein V1264_004710 [Littorina saxatilis]|uniref:Uncharacterized protein n=1 Tax=Littorina saxatilis TaxID=31220 RepID=A0AAN9B207_9CAEN